MLVFQYFPLQLTWKRAIWSFSHKRGIIYQVRRGEDNISLKTNAARILDQSKIPYELKEYTVAESDLSAISVAQKVGLPIEQVYKTLVARGDKTGVIVACIQGDHELHLKCLASLSGNKKVEVVSLKEVQPLTGYIRGGVSPIGMKKHYPVFIDLDIKNHEKIAVSAGLRGVTRASALPEPHRFDFCDQGPIRCDFYRAIINIRTSGGLTL